MFEIREVANKEEYNPLLISKNAPFTQAWFYGEWQEMTGRQVRRFEIKKNSETVGFFQTIVYPLIFSKSFLYIPHGPVIKENVSSNFLKIFSEKISQIAKEENAIFVRFDPVVNFDNMFAHSEYVNVNSSQSSTIGFDPFPKTEDNLEKIFKKVPDYAYHSSYFQPKFEWLVDLMKTEAEILSEMHPKTRYNIGLAARKGIKIEIVSENFKKYFSDFYRLLEETARRDHFNLHPKIYYENIFSALNRERTFLTVAKYGEKILLVNLILLFGETANFLFGGSSDEYKNLMFSHLAQWEAIREAKNRGFKVYNFGGVDDGGSYRTYGGISTFKKRFGGRILEYSDSYDLILKPLWYKLHKLYGFSKSIRQTL